jgi:hypothetical protein
MSQAPYNYRVHFINSREINTALYYCADTCRTMPVYLHTIYYAFIRTVTENAYLTLPKFLFLIIFKKRSTIIPRVTALRTYGHFELPPFPEVAALASELRLFSGMALPPNRLPTAGVAVFSLFINTVRFASLCVIVLHSAIKWTLNCL